MEQVKKKKKKQPWTLGTIFTSFEGGIPTVFLLFK